MSTPPPVHGPPGEVTPGPGRPPGAGPTPPAGRRRRDVPLIAFLSVVAVVVIGSIGAFAVVRTSADKPTDAARGYLQALADADAARALSYTSSAPVDQTLLTDAVLADSRRRDPLTDITVTADPVSDGAVDVHYRLGDTPVDDHYTLSRVSGRWKLDQVSVPANFMPVISTRLPVVVNGTTVTMQATSAFPVSYAVTTGLPDVDWGERSTAIVELGQLSQLSTDLRLEPRLTETGERAFLAGAKKLISTCVAQRDLAPDGCPFGFRQPSGGPRITGSSVRWKLKGNPWASLDKPEISSFVDPGTAKVTTQLTFTCTCRFSNGQACRPQDITNPVTFASDVTQQPLEVQLSAY